MKDRKQILLVEPSYRAEYPPLGLMKISTLHKRRGDDVQFFKDIQNIEERDKFDKRRKHYRLLKKHYDIIYITSLFTYNSWQVARSANYFKNKYLNANVRIGGIGATLVPEYFHKKTGIYPHIGLLEEAENIQPDYTLFPYLKYSITFTTRGCPRKCPFCGVIKHEPNFYVKENWPKDIDITKKFIVFWDNNWLLSPNIENDVERILEFQKIGISYVDFNQGLDCRLFTEEKAKLLSRINIKPLRFAFDNHSEDEHIQKAIEIAQKYGFKDIRVYVLYNFESDEDTPEYFYYRINEINKCGALAYPMKYRPIVSTNGQYISENWDKKLLRALKLSLMFYYSKGMIRKNREGFKEIYGSNSKQFIEKLYKIFEEDKKRK